MGRGCLSLFIPFSVSDENVKITYHFALVMETKVREVSDAEGENADCCHHEIQYDSFLKNYKQSYLLCAPAILLLRINPKEIKSASQRYTCTPLFTAAWFTIANL